MYILLPTSDRINIYLSSISKECEDGTHKTFVLKAILKLKCDLRPGFAYKVHIKPHICT